MRKNIRNAILALMGIVVLLIIFTGVSAGDTLAGAGIGIVAPFLALMFVVIWAIYLIYPTISLSLSNNNSGNIGTKNDAVKYLSILSLILIFAGLAIQILYVMKGGPNQGWGLKSDVHIFSDPANPYLDLQIGFLTMTSGIFIAIVLHIVSTLRKK